MERGHLIAAVEGGSPAAMAGIRPGERLLRIDNRPVEDILDLKIMEADDTVRLLLLSDTGRLRRVAIRKPVALPLGLRFASPAIAPVRRCGNRCLFCFVDHNPAGLRPSLYLKDDDYRLSFLYGNFITLNNLTEEDLRRIIRLRLSPLYVSVHATDPVVRARLFGTERARRGLVNLRRLVRAGIGIHAQVVLCPGINTGLVLEKTVQDLARLGPAVLSLALVPVGLTSHRPASLPPLRRLRPAEARRLLERLKGWQRRFLKWRGGRFVFAADELYHLAGENLPPAEAYEGFPQLENGVGLSRLFLEELASLPEPPLPQLPRPVMATLATGREATPLLRSLVDKFAAVPGLELELVTVENRFFGPPVTTAGLLTGTDLKHALAGRKAGEALFISRAMLKEGSDLFLDDTTPEELARWLRVKVKAVSGPRELAGALWELAGSPEPAAKEGAGP